MHSHFTQFNLTQSHSIHEIGGHRQGLPNLQNPISPNFISHKMVKMGSAEMSLGKNEIRQNGIGRIGIEQNELGEIGLGEMEGFHCLYMYANLPVSL